ncbi:hypothetical protein [Bradyrhizobium sp. 45]|uniref:hypothetical protein n=1 Tax=Bradyrhizobium sp. 45 TaxID=1043587 RepID=UPI001FF8C34F|nr:hypothetical protein [Bradyrhizobium sp. 45]MCK1310806.1 hypothetical protein [Bradyrhizobium sp. 45]
MVWTSRIEKRLRTIWVRQVHKAHQGAHPLQSSLSARPPFRSSTRRYAIIFRNINGQWKISGRGRSATASPSDAAALLIAVAATPISGPAMSIANYESYANLHAVDLLKGNIGSWLTIESLCGLSDGHSLLEALSWIIDHLSKGALLPNSKGIIPQRGEYPYHINIKVDLYAPRSTQR